MEDSHQVKNPSPRAEGQNRSDDNDDHCLDAGSRWSHGLPSLPQHANRPGLIGHTPPSLELRCPLGPDQILAVDKAIDQHRDPSGPASAVSPINQPARFKLRMISATSFMAGPGSSLRHRPLGLNRQAGALIAGEDEMGGRYCGWTRSGVHQPSRADSSIAAASR
jgi:hypothetical protein